MSNDPNEPRRPVPSAATRHFSMTGAVDGVQPDDVDFDFEFPLPLDRSSGAPANITLGEYIITHRIGAGGMGQVFGARHKTMDREVAVKILPKRLSQDPLAVERFYSEVRAQARLMHPNIVTAFDAGCHTLGGHRVHYLVMELVRGESLSQRIANFGPMPSSEVLSILKQAAEALQYAHGLGIVHRDIKPGNMMLTKDGGLKIFDFGLAVLREIDSQASAAAHESQLVGTVEFMSPEQINTPEKVDHRSDLYSLGATLFYMLIGRPMFTGEAIQTALAQIHRRPTPLYEIRGDIDLRFDSVFQSLVAKDVNDRCQSAHDLLEKLYALNLIERPVVPSTVRSTRSSLPRMNFDRPTSLGRGTSTSQRTFEPIGIDLGMMRSRASYVNASHKVEEVPLDGDAYQLRNMLYSDAERIAIGSSAAAKRVQHPNQIFYGLQRWYGLPLLERPFGGRRVPPEVLVSCVLRQLILTARHNLPNASHAVVTIPGCYDQMHRISTQTACAIAGVEVLQLLDKPLAAALAEVEIGMRLARASGKNEFHRTMLVVMLSGGACEAAVVKADLEGARTLSLVGDWKRGTLRWQDRATKRLAGLIENKFGVSARDNLNLASQLQRTMERALERLRHTSRVPFIVELPKGRYEDAIHRDRLSEWVEDLEGDCGLFAKEAVRRANLPPDSIDSLLLIGDVRWLPHIQSELVKLVRSDARVVPIGSADLARGAALQARALMPPIDPTTPKAFAATSYDLGMIVQEGNLQNPTPKILVPKDSSLGYQVSRTLRFTQDVRRQPVLQWVEGTRSGGNNWHRLSQVDLQHCFEGRKTADPVQLRIEVDESGIWCGALTWLAGNKHLAIPPLAEPIMDAVSIRQWRDWLESIMLCNMEPVQR